MNTFHSKQNRNCEDDQNFRANHAVVVIDQIRITNLRLQNVALRGGGCGASQENFQEIEFSSKNDLPRDFFQQLKNNCDALKINSQILSNDETSLNSIMLPLQWFHYNSEYINDCAQNIDIAGQIYVLFLQNASDILSILPNYIRSQGFVAYKALQIVNELLRVVFSFQRKNERRKMDEFQKKSLLEFVEKIQLEIDAESTKLWKSGIEYELSLIEIMLRNCNINYSEGKQKSISFIESLMKSVLTLEFKDDLVDQLLDCGKYLFNLAYEAVSYPKEVYYTYYIFQNLKWNLIKSLKNDGTVQSEIDNLIKKYQSHIETSENWMIHYFWIQMITDLLCYRIRINKDSLAKYPQALQRQEKWNNLIKKKSIKPLPYSDQGVILLYKNNQFIGFDTKDKNLERKIDKFSQLCTALMSEKFKAEQDLWSIYINFTFKQQQGLQDLGSSINDQVSFLQIAKENLGRLKECFEINYAQLKSTISTLSIFIHSYNNKQNKENDFNYYQEQLEIRKDKLYNCTIQLTYISGEIIEKTSIIFIQTQRIQKQYLQLNEVNSKIFETNQEILINIVKHVLSFVSETQLLQVKGVKNELNNYKQCNEKTQFQYFDLVQNEFVFQKVIEQIENYFISEKIVNEKIYESLVRNLYNQQPLYSSQNNFQDTILQIVQSPIINLYSKLIIDSLKFDFDEMAKLDYQVQQIISLLQIFQNLNSIQIGKSSQLLKSFEIIKNSNQSSSKIESSQEKKSIKTIVQNMLEISKNIFEVSLKQEINENQMSLQVEEFLALLEHSLSSISCISHLKEKEQNKDEKEDEKEALSMILELQELVFEFQNNLDFPKDQCLKRIAQTINLQIQNWSSKSNNNVSSVKFQQGTELEFIKRFFGCEKVLKGLIGQLKQVASHLKIKITIQYITQQASIPLQQTIESKKYDNLLLNITKDIVNQIENIQLVFLNILSFFKENEEIIQQNLIFILSTCFKSFDQQSLNIDQIYIETIDLLNNSKSTDPILELGNDFKVRECLVMNLMKIQACTQEEEIIKFVQWNTKEMWVKERNEKVRSLLKNKDLLELQRKLFSKDLKSFSVQLQQELQQKIDKLSEMEQGLRLEGNEDIRVRLQEELKLASQDIDKYVENISDMSTQINIGLVFLKEMIKDIKSIQSKIDALSANVKQISDDVRKLRGKTYKELLEIRKKKVLEQAKLNEIDSVYIPLKTIEYDSITGQEIQTSKGNEKSFLLVEKFQIKTSSESLEGEVNEFLWGQQTQKDVMLLKGQAGSGKSRSTRKIEEFLWKIQGSESKWIPIYVSLPQIKDPKFNLFEQAMDSEYFNFDSTQTREFKEAIRQKKEFTIFILDSYDEMKNDCIQSNLINTNNFYSDFEIADVGQSIKFIITTRTEILNSTRYYTWFLGKSQQSLKDVELIRFDQGQIEDYLKKYVELSVKRKIKNLYEFIKQLNGTNLDPKEFQEIWLILEDLIIECNSQNQKGQLLFEKKEEEIIIKNIKSHQIFKYLKDEQIIALRKDLQQLWSSKMFESAIHNVNIEQLLTTPFMLEIVVQVLPQMIKRVSNQYSFKEELCSNLEIILKQSRKSNKLIQYYSGQKDAEQTTQQKQTKEKKINKEQQDANRIIEKLQNQGFFQFYSLTDKVDVENGNLWIQKNQYKIEKYANIVAIALKMKQYTVFEFYDCFIQFYHHQQLAKLSQLGKITNLESFSIDVFTYSQSLAIDLTVNQQISINYKQKGKLKFGINKVDKYERKDWEEQYVNDTDDNSQYMKLIKSCLLITNKGSFFSFNHKSIQEFLVAKYIYDEISKINSKFDQLSFIQNETSLQNSKYNNDEFNISKTNYQGVVAILTPQLQYLNNVDEKLIHIVKLSQRFVRSSSNSMYLLSQRNTFLGGMNFQGLKLKDTNLFALNFFGSDLSGSQFENIIVDFCNFNFCNLNNTLWSEIGCREKPCLKGHKALVQAISFSQDGSLFASGDLAGLIIIWDLKTYKEIRRIDGFYQKQIIGVAFLQNDQILMIYCKSSLQIFSLIPNLNKPLLKFTYDRNTDISSVMFSKDERIMYLIDENGALSFYSIEYFCNVGNILNEKKVQIQFNLEPQTIKCLRNKRIYSMDISDNQQYIVLGSKDGYFLLNIVQQEAQILKEVNLQAYYCNKFLGNDSFVICLGTELFFAKIDQLEALEKIGETFFPIISISTNKKDLFAVCTKQNISLWDIKRKKQIAIFNGHSGRILVVSMSPNGLSLASSGGDGLIRLWNMNGQEDFASKNFHSRPIVELKFSPDGQILASTCQNCEIRFWSIHLNNCLNVIRKHQLPIVNMDFSQDQLFFLSLDLVSFYIWSLGNIKNIQLFFTLKNLELKFKNMFTRNFEVLLRSNLKDSEQEQLSLWNLANIIKNSQHEIILKTKGNISQIQICPTQQLICYIDRWELEVLNIQLNSSQKLYPRFILQFAFSEDGNTLITVDENHFAYLWDRFDLMWNLSKTIVVQKQLDETLCKLKCFRKWKQLHFISRKKILSCKISQSQFNYNIERQLDLLESQFIVFNYEKSLIAFAQKVHEANSIQHCLYVIELHNFQEIKKFSGIDNEVLSISFSYLDHYIAAGDKNGKIYAWNYKSEIQVVRIFQVVGSIHSIQFLMSKPEILISCSMINDNIFREKYKFTYLNLLDNSSIDLKFSENNIINVKISPQGSQLAVIKESKIQLFQLKTDQLLYESFQEIQDLSSVVIFDSKENYLIYCYDYDSVQIWDIQNQKLISKFNYKGLHKIEDLSFSLDAKQILVRCRKSLGFELFLDSHNEIRQIERLEFDFQIQFSQLICEDQILFITDKNKLLIIKKLKLLTFSSFQFESESLIDPILLQNGNIYTMEDEKIKIYDIKEQKKLEDIVWDLFTEVGKFGFLDLQSLNKNFETNQFQAHESAITQLEISQNSSFLATMDCDCYLKLWNVEEQQVPKLICTYFTGYPEDCFKFSYDSNYFFRAVHEQIIRIEIKNCSQILTKIDNINASIDHNGMKLRKTQKDFQDVLIFVTDRGLEQKKIESETIENLCTFYSPIEYFDLSYDSQFFAYSCYSSSFEIIYIKNLNGKRVSTKKLNQGSKVVSIFFSPDGQLFSVGENLEIKIWKQQEFKLQGILKVQDQITEFAYSSDGVHFATGTYGGSINLYISNITGKPLNKKQTKIVSFLGKKPNIGCIKIFSKEPFLQLQNCNIKDVQSSQEFKVLLNQKIEGFTEK